MNHLFSNQAMSLKYATVSSSSARNKSGEKSLLCTVLGREAKTQEFMRELLEESPLIIGQEVSVLVLTHANFTHLGISSQ